MADIKTLKEKLVDHLISELQAPGEGGVPNAVLSTAAKMVKDFSHEIDDDEADAAEAAIKNQKLAAFLAKQPNVRQ